MIESPYIESIEKIANYIETAKFAGVSARLPLTGGVFTGRNCWMGSTCKISANGLHEVTYWVLEKSSGMVLGGGASKAIALAQARIFLRSISPVCMDKITLALNAELEKKACLKRQEIAKEKERLNQASEKTEKPVPARRKRVFDKSNGKCHYCGCALQLTGTWHIEHMMPKALGGTNSPGNLVAACAPCNYKKRDQTANEFISGRRAIEGSPQGAA